MAQHISRIQSMYWLLYMMVVLIRLMTLRQTNLEMLFKDASHLLLISLWLFS